MGQCCASRTDLTGKDKAAAAKGGKAKGALETKGGPAVKVNPLDVVRNAIT